MTNPHFDQNLQIFTETVFVENNARSCQGLLSLFVIVYLEITLQLEICKGWLQNKPILALYISTDMLIYFSRIRKTTHLNLLFTALLFGLSFQTPMSAEVHLANRTRSLSFVDRIRLFITILLYYYTIKNKPKSPWQLRWA